MLQSIREKAQGLVAWIIALLILSSLLWAFNSFLAQDDKGVLAAKVNGEPIYWETVERQLDSTRGQIEAPGLTPELESAHKNQILQNLVHQAAILTGAEKQGFRIPLAQARAVIARIPQFQEDSVFSAAKFKKFLDQAGLKEANLFKQIQQELLFNQTQQALVSSHFVLPDDIKLAARLFGQTRDVRYLTLKAENFESEIEPSVTELKKFFEDKHSQFAQPEQVSLEYVQLSLDDVMKTIPVDEPKLKKFFEHNPARFTLAEKSHARHILLSVARDIAVDTAEDTRIKAQAQKLLDELHQGANFQTLAKQHSEDPGSRDQGGDLGWLEKGETVPDFENALFKLKKAGERSDLVRTPFGYHIIELVAHEPEQIRAFDEVHDLVDEQYRRTEAQPIFEERAETMATLAFENPNSLEKLVADLGLSLHRTPFFSRNGGPDVAQHPSVIKSAFSPEVLNEGHNSELIALDASSAVVLRVHSHKAPITPVFEDIQQDVRTFYIQAHANERAQAVAKELKGALETDQALTEWLNRYKLVVQAETALTRKSHQVAPIVINTAFSLNRIPEEGCKKSVRIVDFAPREWAVVALEAVHENNDPLTDEDKELFTGTLTNIEGDLEYSLYAHELIRSAKIFISNSQVPN